MSKIQKRLIVRRNELADAERLLRSSRAQVEAGELSHAKVLSVQLRALLFETRTNTPLLFDLAGITGQKIMCAGTEFESVDLSGPVPFHRLLRWVSVPTWPPSQQPIEFNAWLSEPTIGDMTPLDVAPTAIEPMHSPRMLIELHANRLGGAHYDTILNADQERQSRISLRPDGRLSMIEELLIHTSEVAEYHCRMIVSELDKRAFGLLEQALAAG